MLVVALIAFTCFSKILLFRRIQKMPSYTVRGQIRVHLLTKIEHSSFKFELKYDFKKNIHYAKQEYNTQDTEETDGFTKDLLLKMVQILHCG